MPGSVVRLILTMAVVLSVVSVFPAPGVLAETPLPIKIGYQATADWLLFVARDLALFEKAGLAPTYVKLGAGAPMIAAVQNESIDVASLGCVAFLIGLSEGMDGVVIGINPEGAYVEGLVARKDSGIDTPTDLKGKRVGYARGSTAHFGLMMTLRQHGIRLDQVTLLNMSPADQLAALAKKEIDAAMVWEPWMQRMVHEVNARIVTTEGDLGIYTNVDVYAVRRDWLRDKRETAVRFLRALVMAYDVLQKDPRIAIRVLVQEMGINHAWAESIYKDAPPPKIYEWANPRYPYSLAKNSALHRRLGFLAGFLLDEQLISKPVDVRDVMDVSVITEVLKTWKTGQ